MSVKHKSIMLFRLCMVMLLTFAGGTAFAQLTVTGKISSSANGEGLVGATVLVKGTTTGVISEDGGAYEIQVPSDDATLVISYIGYERQEIAVNGQSTINVTMVATNATLDEVVVTGYSTAKASQVTSAITSVKEEDFNQGQVNDPTQLIQGKVAGLNISKVGGDPNGGFDIRLRGISSFGANASPLIVIDGVIGGELNSVDPNDIQSIDILKDGSAAAIYGTRASAGVIIITTKKGLAGRTSVDYNGYTTVEQVARTAPFATAAEFREIRADVLAGNPDLDRGQSTDWIDEVTAPGVSQVHNLSLSGGVGEMSYRAAINYRDINGVGINSGFDQLNGRLNLTQKTLNDRLKITLNLSNTERRSSFGFAESFRYANVYNPTEPVLSDNPAFVENFGGYYQRDAFDYFNPVALAEQNLNEGIFKTLLATIRGDLEITSGLTFSASYNLQRRSNLFGQFYSRASKFRGNATPNGGERLGSASRYTEDEVNELFETTLNYKKTFNALDVDLLGGYSFNRVDYQGFGVGGAGLPSDAFTYNNLSSLTDRVSTTNSLNVSGGRNNYLVVGFFGRARLAYDETYNLTASLRYDGSSRFGSGNKWGLFPAVSGSVMLTNLFDISGVDELKVRAGYGVTGALPGNSYESLARFSTGDFFLYEGTFTQTIGPSSNFNPNLQWETKGEFDFGIDFQLLGYKLRGSIDYFNRVTRDLIFDAQVCLPPFNFPNLRANLNNVALRSSGLEAAIGYEFESGDFKWNPNVTITYYNPILLDTLEGVVPDFQFGTEGQFLDPNTSPGAPGLNDNPTIALNLGSELGQYFGYDLDIPATEANNTDDNPDNDGWVYNDIAGINAGDDGVLGTADDFVELVPDGVQDATDRQAVEIGDRTGIPSFSLGLANAFSYGDFTFSFFFRGDFGHSLINMNRVFYEPLGGQPNLNVYITDQFVNVNAAPEFNTYHIERADFLVLDNASLSYNFDIGKDRTLQVYVARQNLFYITNYSGVDPNVRWGDPGPTDNGGDINLNPNQLAPGIARRNTFFRTRTFTAGVRIGL